MIVALIETTYSFPPSHFSAVLIKEYRKGLFFEYQVFRYPSNFSVPSGKNVSVGIVTDPWNLNFGRIPKGFRVRRFVDLYNSNTAPIKMTVKVHGNISKFVRACPETRTIKPRESVRIEFSVQPGEEGTYVGEIDIVLIKPKFGVIAFLLG